jgi:predicted murein hydrolase (TIGR00659 family)
MNEFFLNSTYFGVVLSLLSYWAALKISAKVKSTLCNPLLVASVIIIAVLLLFGIEYETFDKGAAYLTYFLNPATVCLAVPLYRQFEVLKSNLKAILLGIFSGCVACMITLLGFSAIFAFSPELTASILPKSITTAIAIGLSAEIGGMPSVTVACIVFTGIFGACTASMMFKIFKIEEPVAQGLATGASAHAIGTSRAIELGEVQAAMSSLAIVVTGIITVVIVPIVMGMIS